MAYLSDEVNCKKCYQLNQLKEQLEFERLENSILKEENKILKEKIKNFETTSTPSTPNKTTSTPKKYSSKDFCNYYL